MWVRSFFFSCWRVLLLVQLLTRWSSCSLLSCVSVHCCVWQRRLLLCAVWDLGVPWYAMCPCNDFPRSECLSIPCSALEWGPLLGSSAWSEIKDLSACNTVNCVESGIFLLSVCAMFSSCMKVGIVLLSFAGAC